jgi:ribosomal protein S6
VKVKTDDVHHPLLMCHAKMTTNLQKIKTKVNKNNKISRHSIIKYTVKWNIKVAIFKTEKIGGDIR